MPIYEVTDKEIVAVSETTFNVVGLHERRDLQRLLREHIEVIAPDTLLISEEFGEWEDSKRRIDLLAIDKDANLVAIELKRTEDGGYMELQCIRYASMVSTMTFDQATNIFSRYLKQVGKETLDARDMILEFLDWEESDDDLFAQDVRIVLASAEFSKELTTSVLWLIDHEIDIRCVRLKPYQLGARLLVDVQQIIPLPEAAHYQVQVREKAQKDRAARVSGADFTRFDVQINGELHKSVWKRNALYLICKRLVNGGISPDEIASAFTWRNNAWYSVEGTVNGEAFNQLASAKATSGGHSFDQPRWFCEDEELFHADGKTFAFSKMWGGKNWHRAMDLLKEKYSGFKIEFSPTS
jgi:hypothetical protein